MEKIMVVNADGWYGEVLDFTGKYSELFNDKNPEHEMLEVKVLGYTDLFKEKDMFGFRAEEYPIGKVAHSIRANFKPYPEYLGFSAGEWVKK